jgi:hypothetical protein
MLKKLQGNPKIQIVQWWQGLSPLDKNLFLIVGAGIILVGVSMALWKVPHWQVGPWKARLEDRLDKMDKDRQAWQLTVRDSGVAAWTYFVDAQTDGSVEHLKLRVERLKLRNDVRKLESDARTTLVQAFGGLALLIGIYLSIKTWRTAQEGQITDRFTKAINQLGEAGPEKTAIRLGGIYALERIARDSKRDHWSIMEVLTAYVREHAPWPAKDIPLLADDLSPTEKSPEGEDQPQPEPASDIQAILTVLGRRTRIYEEGEDRHLNLARTDLRRAYLREAHLEGVDLTEAHLEGAHLFETRLERAHLRGAHLKGANLYAAHLEKADLTKASLAGADLQGAHLENANFEETRLEDTNFEAAHLKGAQHLTVKQLDPVKTLYDAQLDASLKSAISERHWELLKFS